MILLGILAPYHMSDLPLRKERLDEVVVVVAAEAKGANQTEIRESLTWKTRDTTKTSQRKIKFRIGGMRLGRARGRRLAICVSSQFNATARTYRRC